MFAGIFRDRFWVAPALAGAVEPTPLDPCHKNSHRLKPVLPMWVGALALLCAATAVRGHEIGTTRVAVLFEQGKTYDVEIVTDAVSLADKLEALCGSPSRGETHPGPPQSLLPAFAEHFPPSVTITFTAPAI